MYSLTWYSLHLGSLKARASANWNLLNERCTSPVVWKLPTGTCREERIYNAIADALVLLACSSRFNRLGGGQLNAPIRVSQRAYPFDLLGAAGPTTIRQESYYGYLPKGTELKRQTYNTRMAVPARLGALLRL